MPPFPLVNKPKPMKPTQRDLKSIEAIKHRLDDPNTFPKEKEDLTDDWLAVGMDYMDGLLDDVDSFPKRKGGSILVSSAETLADTALTKGGICQAETFAKSFMQALDLIVVSPSVSSRQTAEPLISRCSDATVETWDVGESVLLDPNKRGSESEDQRKEAASRYWNRGDVEWKDGVGSESLVEFIRRVDSALRRLRENPDIWCIVFTHNLFITAVGLRLVEPEIPIDASFFAKLREAQNLGNPKGHWVGGLKSINLMEVGPSLQLL